MNSLRDLLVCGPVAVLLGLLHGAGTEPAVAVVVSVAAYAITRVAAEYTGLERAMYDRRKARDSVRLAREAARETAARSPPPEK